MTRWLFTGAPPPSRCSTQPRELPPPRPPAGPPRAPWPARGARDGAPGRKRRSCHQLSRADELSRTYRRYSSLLPAPHSDVKRRIASDRARPCEVQVLSFALSGFGGCVPRERGIADGTAAFAWSTHLRDARRSRGSPRASDRAGTSDRAWVHTLRSRRSCSSSRRAPRHETRPAPSSRPGSVR